MSLVKAGERAPEPVGAMHDVPRLIGNLSAGQLLEFPQREMVDANFDNVEVGALDGCEAGAPTMIQVSFPDAPLRARGLLNLLGAIAPVKEPEWMGERGRTFEIMDDWIIFDPSSERHKVYAAAHAGLPGWEQLARSYAALMATLEPLNQSRQNPRQERIVAPEKGVEGWAPAAYLGSSPMIATPELLDMLYEFYGQKQTHMHLLDHLRKRESRNLDVKAQSKTDDELLAEFKSMDILERNSDRGGFLYGSDNPRSYSLHDAGNEAYRAAYLARYCTAFMTADGRRLYAHGLVPGEDIQAAYAARRTRFVTSEEASVGEAAPRAAYEIEVMTVKTVIGEQTIIVPGMLSFQDLGLIPAVRWTVDADGKRTNVELPSTPYTAARQNVLHGTAGLAVLAYLQPPKHERWPKQRRLPAMEDPQEMKAAQVPLLLLHDNSLLNNELMRQAEEMAGLQK